jgi:hypothetical protein
MPKLFEDLNFDSVTVVRMGKTQWSRFGFEQTYHNASANQNEGALTSNVGCRRKELYKHAGNI